MTNEIKKIFLFIIQYKVYAPLYIGRPNAKIIKGYNKIPDSNSYLLF